MVVALSLILVRTVAQPSKSAACCYARHCFPQSSTCITHYALEIAVDWLVSALLVFVSAENFLISHEKRPKEAETRQQYIRPVSNATPFLHYDARWKYGRGRVHPSAVW